MSSKNTIHDQEIKGVTITDNFPNVNMDTGKLLSYDTLKTNICIYENLKGYKLPYVFDSAYEGEIFYSEKKYDYLICERSDTIGYLFKTPTVYKKVLIDSILKKYSFSYIDPYTALFKKNVSTCISSIKDPRGDMLEETYSLRGKEDTNFTGKATLLFKNADTSSVFSLSRELERAKKMKLVRIDYLNNKQYFKDYNYTLDEISEFTTIEDISEDGKKEMLNYFSVYKNLKSK